MPAPQMEEMEALRLEGDLQSPSLRRRRPIEVCLTYSNAEFEEAECPGPPAHFEGIVILASRQSMVSVKLVLFCSMLWLRTLMLAACFSVACACRVCRWVSRSGSMDGPCSESPPVILQPSKLTSPEALRAFLSPE